MFCTTPNPICTARNPAYGMSVRQAPNDAVNIQTNDEPEYEVIRGISQLFSDTCLHYVSHCVCVCVFMAILQIHM